MFSEDKMRLEVLQKIEACREITTIDLENMNIVDNEILEIVQKIKLIQPSVSVINLDNNDLSDKGAMILAKYVPDFHHLTELSLQFNQIGKEGALGVFGLKKGLAALDILFHGNKIIDQGEMAAIERVAIKHAGRSI